MDLEPKGSTLERLRRRAEVALYRTLRPARRRTLGLRTAAVALVIAVGLAGAGGFLLGESETEPASGVPPGALAATDSGGQRGQEAALQKYLDEMETLLTGGGLRDAGADSEVRTMARTRTLAALEGLDPSGKTQVVRFLSSETSLVRSAPGEDPIVSLMRADLRGINLGQDAPGRAEPRAAVPIYDLSHADLTYADLGDAGLNGTIMHGTRLVGADLRDADLSGAVLRGANLSGANLSGATGKTVEELERECRSLDGAIMPDGRKYEG